MAVWGSRYIYLLEILKLKTTYVFWKNDGWETTFVSKWSLFEGHVSIAGSQWFVYISVSALLSDNDHCLGKSLRISTIHPFIPTFPMNLQGVSSVSTVSLKLFHGTKPGNKKHTNSASRWVESGRPPISARQRVSRLWNLMWRMKFLSVGAMDSVSWSLRLVPFFCFLWLLFGKVLGRGLGFVCYISRHDMYLFMYTYLCKYAFLFGR